MITEEELQEAIAECQGQRNPNANTCLKLASYLTILDHQKAEEPHRTTYSFAPPPDNTKPTFGRALTEMVSCAYATIVMRQSERAHKIYFALLIMQ